MKQCTCGSTKFTAHHICRHDIMVDGNNNFLLDVGIYDSETPYGPYHCARCDKEYGELGSLAEGPDTDAAPSESADGTEAAESGASQVFERNKLSETSQSAAHIEWDDLAILFHDMLTGLFGRNIWTEAKREDYYHWEIALAAPISPAELEVLFDIAQASDYDRMETLYDEDSPVSEICEGLCKKLMAKLLPFDLALTRADDEGVWFIGSDR